jgi:hypothetical protein
VRPLLKTGVATAAVLLLAVPLMSLRPERREAGTASKGQGHVSVSKFRPHASQRTRVVAASAVVMAALAAATSAASAEVMAALAVAALEVSAATSAASVGALAEWGLRAAAQDWEPARSRGALPHRHLVRPAFSLALSRADAGTRSTDGPTPPARRTRFLRVDCCE